MLRGVVHDPRARALGGVAGHAGLFGTADDLAVYAQALLDGGRGPDGRRILGPLTVRAMTDAGPTPAGQRRGLGWDVDTPHSSPRGALFGPEGFGHTGFTGTSLWVDKETETFVIVLTSRLHPDGKAARADGPPLGGGHGGRLGDPRRPRDGAGRRGRPPRRRPRGPEGARAAGPSPAASTSWPATASPR
jgi:CubicO group peptidase (beta-lactamase class C family)